MKKIFVILALLSLFIFAMKPNLFCGKQVARWLQKLPFSSVTLGPPKGYTFAKELSKQAGITYIPLTAAEEIGIDEFPLSERKGSMIESKEDFVIEIPHARIYGRNGVVITEEDRILADTAYEWINTLSEHSIFKKLKFPKLEQREERIAVIASKGADCFYHWFFEVLPRLELLKRSGVAYDKLYIGSLRANYQRPCLEKLGIDFEKVIWTTGKTHIQASSVIVPSLAGGESGAIPKWACAFLRETFLPKGASSCGKRLYVSRRQAPTRRILNEEELLVHLRERGFEEVVLESLPIEKQAELFASAECIIAPHGAGFSHLVFCSPGTTVYELFCPKYLNRCYWVLSRQMGLDYHFQVGSQENLTSEQLAHNDYTVSIESILSSISLKQ